MVKKLFGISSNTNQQHNTNQPTAFMVVDDPSVLQGYYNEQLNNNNNGQFFNNNNSSNQQQQQQFIISSQFNNNSTPMLISIPNNSTTVPNNNNFTTGSFGNNNGQASSMFINMNNQLSSSFNAANNNNMNMQLSSSSSSYNNNNNIQMVQLGTPQQQPSFLFGSNSLTQPHQMNNSNNNNYIVNNQQQQQQQQLVNIVLNNNLEKKYTPVIKWSVSPNTAYTFSNNQSTSITNSEADNIMTIDPVFTQDDCKVAKGNLLVNTKLFCLSEQSLRDYQYLRPSVQTDNLYHFAEMDRESSWLPNERIAPKKTSHNCLVNDWLIFCSQDPQLLKLVGRYINGASNADVQLFADFVLVTSNNHDEDTRESLFGKQRFKGGIPLQMKLVRNSANNANMTPLLYFEKRINRESVNNKEAPSASGMGGKRVAQLRIYLKDSNQEICLVHSDGFWVRTKSREEIHRTSPRDVPVQQETVQTKKKRNAFYGLFQGSSNNARMKRENMEESSSISGSNSGMMQQQQQQQTPKIVFQPSTFGNQQMQNNQMFNQTIDLGQMSNSTSSYGSNSYLGSSAGGNYIIQNNMSPNSGQLHMQNGGNDQSEISSLSSTPNNASSLSVSQHSLITNDVAEILRSLTISLPNNQGGGHHSRNSSFTSPNGLASSCSSTSSSSYLVGNSNDNYLQNMIDGGNDVDVTITKLDAAINFFSSMKEAYVKMKENHGDAPNIPNVSEMYAQFSSSIQDKRKDKGFKRVRQGNESGAVSPQSNHSGKSLNVQFRTTSLSAPNTSTLNMNNSSPLVNNVMSNVGYTNSSFNGNAAMMVNQGMPTFQNNGFQNNGFQNNSSSLNNLPMKNFDSDLLPHTLFNSADTDVSQDIFNM